jgi:hypothetical protein
MLLVTESTFESQRPQSSWLMPVILMWEVEIGRIMVLRPIQVKKLPRPPSQPRAEHSGSCLSSQTIQEANIGETVIQSQSR